MKFNTLYFISLVLFIMNSSCIKKEAPIQPQSCFNILNEEIRINDTVSFSSDCSENADFFQWIFDDSTFSYIANPQHIYDSIGTKKVTLVTFNKELSDTTHIEINVLDIIPDPVAVFSFNPSTPFVDQSVAFSNNSTNADSYLWDFGDGSSSNAFEPSHSYSDTGTFNITLTANSAIGSNELSKTIVVQEETNEDPIASFTITPQFPIVDKNVSFLNTSENASSYLWDFGDGNTSTEYEPIHTYITAGKYTIKLSAVKGDITHTNEQEITVANPKNYHWFENTNTLYLNDFYVDNGDYWTGTSDSIDATINEAEGMFFISNKSQSNYTFASGAFEMPNEETNYDLEIKYTLDYSGNYYWGGLYWAHNDATDFNYFLWTKLENQGYFNIAATTDSLSWYLGEGGSVSDFNTLTVRKYNDTYYFFLNEEFVYKHPFEPYFGRALGIFIGQGLDLNIDYISLVELIISETKNASVQQKNSGGYGSHKNFPKINRSIISKPN